jgi:hypothetical protein
MLLMNSTLGRALALGAGALSALVAAGASATPADAELGIACPNPTSRVFAPWNDSAYYAYAPDGGVEAGATGWTLAGGASVASGNESFAVHGKSDRYSLALPAGSSATTAPMCIGLLSGQMRFFTRNTGSSSSRLKVQVVYLGGVGGLLGTAGKVLGIADIGYLSSGGVWQPSPAVRMLGGLLPLLTQGVQFRFSPADSSGSWRLDDVYVDPLKHT